MQAISKSGHEKFCKQIQDIKNRNSLQDSKLLVLESELADVLLNYQQHINNLRTLIMEYNEKQKTIKLTLKKLIQKDSYKTERNYSVYFNKKMESL